MPPQGAPSTPPARDMSTAGPALCRAALLAGALVARGLLANRWPLINECEFALAFALGTAFAVLVLDGKRSPSPPAVQWRT